ncbi:MAG: ABC transporter substrate-binding protein, partial [Planifilum fulgidum]
LLEKQVDAIAGYVQGYAPGVEIGAGQEVDILWYADCDVVAISNGIIVHNDLLESNPDLVRRFVRATVRGFLYGHESPDEAVSFLHKYSDTIEDERARREMEFSWKSWVPDSARGTPLGWMPPEDWEKTLETLAEYGDVSQVPDPEDVYTNEFVPEGEEFIPPQP